MKFATFCKNRTACVFNAMETQNEMQCPCQSGKTYVECCAPFHQQSKRPETAEQLMRSRYAAYVLKKIDYIISTTLPSQQKYLDVAGITAWANATQWLGLKVLHHNPKAGKNRATVEFQARFNSPQGEQIHHELSLFIKQQDRWFFVDPNC